MVDTTLFDVKYQATCKSPNCGKVIVADGSSIEQACSNHLASHLNIQTATV